MGYNIKNTNENSNKKAKKNLLIIIISVIAVMAVLVAASLIIDLVESKKGGEYEIDYNFYPADYEENIFEDEKYISLTKDGFISYCDSSTNITLGIDKEIAKNYGEEIDFLVPYHRKRTRSSGCSRHSSTRYRRCGRGRFSRIYKSSDFPR